MYPKKFEDLIAAFRHLPGVGIKTAERYAFTVLDWDQETLEEMIARQSETDWMSVKSAEICVKAANVRSVQTTREIIGSSVSCRARKM